MHDQTKKHSLVLGTQWGDEGKGKIVDILSESADAVVRFQGGANAGHTVKFSGEKHILHLLPSGILRAGKLAVLGNGMVIDPETLLTEIDAINRAGIETEGRLFISDRAHVVMPYHRLLDKARESQAGKDKIGTTLRGIGPCYEDKVSRQGFRMGDLLDPDILREKLNRILPGKNKLLTALYGEKPLDLETVLQTLYGCGEKLKSCIGNGVRFLQELESSGKRILFEGAQGTLLDIDHGTYPFVTSSNTSLGAVGTGCGFSPRKIGEVLGIVKAYTTRVGAGPFPTEGETDVAESLREKGGEFGATTGRPRRCGWLDVVALSYTLWVNDVDSLVITKLDVLEDLAEIKVAVSYRIGRGADGDCLSSCIQDEQASNVQVDYETLPGWQAPISDCRTYEELPDLCKQYVAWVCRRLNRPVRMISVGPNRDQTIIFDEPFWPDGSRG